MLVLILVVQLVCVKIANQATPVHEANQEWLVTVGRMQRQERRKAGGRGHKSKTVQFKEELQEADFTDGGKVQRLTLNI